MSDWKVPVSFAGKSAPNGKHTPNHHLARSSSDAGVVGAAPRARRERSPLRSTITSTLEHEKEKSPAPVSSRSSLNASSPAVLIASELDDELADLMTIPKLPFEIVDEGGFSAPPTVPQRLSPPSQRPAPPVSNPRPSSAPPPLQLADHKLARNVLDGPRSPTLSVSRIDKSLVNKDLDGKGVVKWCSWCFQYAPQKQLEHRWMGRNAHECGNCFNETCVCVMCSEGACRSFGSSADKLCFKCDGTFAKNKVASAMKAEGRCSWCCQKTSHTLLKAAVLGRDLYTCDGCGKQTALCKSCSSAFSRCPDGQEEVSCLKCAKVISSWNDPPPKTSPRNYGKNKSEEDSGEALSPRGDDDSIQGWCSWCVEDTRHELVTRSLLTRNTYRCIECENRTLCCLQCEEGMSRSGVGWDDKICVSCGLRSTILEAATKKGELPAWDWLQLKGKKDAVFDPERYTHARVMTLLMLASPFKENAMAQGMIRPFLILVSMQPSKRNRVSNELGWSCIPSPLFGDAHAEAWEIINANHVGLQARLNSTIEKLNPLGRNVTWIEAVERVSLIFGKFDGDDDVVAKLTPEGCLEESKKPYSRYVQVQEHVLMIRVGRLYYKYLIANHLKPPQSDKATAIMNKLKDATGMTDVYGLTWAVSIFFKPKSGVPRFSETLDAFLTSREDSSGARALLVCLEIIKQMLRLYIGFAVFIDDHYATQ